MMYRLMAGMCALIVAASAHAGKYPSRSVTLIVPYAAGSATDIMARGLASEMQRVLGQTVVVLIREGASGVIGMNALTQSPPDGLTLAYTPLTPVTVQPHLIAGTGLGPDAVAPVCGVTENILAIAVKADSPLHGIDELIQKARSGAQASYGSPGPNSGPALGVEDLARSQHVPFTHVAFRGDIPSLQELMAGRLDFAAIVAASASAFVKAGRVRLLAVMSDRRHPEFPTVPTLTELHYPVTQLSYTAIFAPKDTPKDILDTLEHACAETVASDAIQRLAAGSNQVMKYQPRSRMDKSVREQYQMQGRSLHPGNGDK